MHKLKIVFFGDPQHFCSNEIFEYLYRIKKNEVKIIAAVIPPPPKKVHRDFFDFLFRLIKKNIKKLLKFSYINKSTKSFTEICFENDIPIYSSNSKDLNSKKNCSQLKKDSPDIFFSVCYSEIMKKQLIDIPKIAAIGIHPSLLPAYRGSHPVFWGAVNGEKEFGLTAYHLDEGIDTGDIIVQKRILVNPYSFIFLTQLYKFVVDKLFCTVVNVVLNYALKDNFPHIKQKAKYASHFRHPTKKEMLKGYLIFIKRKIAILIRHK